jgi:hypothetical protein
VLAFVDSYGPNRVCCTTRRGKKSRLSVLLPGKDWDTSPTFHRETGKTNANLPGRECHISHETNHNSWWLAF